ncbi:MAG: type II toxin-antitoxin system PemK/MazF family toxin [Spirochaetaceae bacterium]|jgi:mRNA interferase MazF|nr:type II toxin-antitoxin system PemK/MazF family toxin [Spirochaetaceae bacterium]
MIRGELWWIDYGVPYGSEPGYRRPVIIIQNDIFNNSKINTTVVIPLTTNLLLADVPGNILLDKKESKLGKNSVILLSQIGVVDKERFMEKISKIDKTTMEKIDNNIMFILGIKKL